MGLLLWMLTKGVLLIANVGPCIIMMAKERHWAPVFTAA